MERFQLFRNFNYYHVLLGLLSLLIIVSLVSCAVSRGVQHEVRKGQTLWQISQVYDVNLEILMKVNNIKDARQLKPGTMLTIPGASKQRDVPSYSTARAQTSNKTTPAPKSVPSSSDRRVKRPDNSRKRSGTAGFTPSWPCQGRIASRFDPTGDPPRQGILIHVPPGSDIKAMEDGKIQVAGQLDEPPQLESYGNLVIISHDRQSQFVSVYAHLRSIDASKGQTVNRGDVIGQAGQSGEVDQPVCYFEIRYNVKPRDPLLFLGDPS